jgi:hypothetical protein
MSSYSTQVAQLQFEYTYELDEICELIHMSLE